MFISSFVKQPASLFGMACFVTYVTLECGSLDTALRCNPEWGINTPLLHSFGCCWLINVAAAIQKHNAISSVDNLSWYYGAGAGVYLYSFDFVTTESSTGVGISGYLGLDYKFADIPLNLSVDWVPTFFVAGYGNGFGGGYGGLSARYVLK